MASDYKGAVVDAGVAQHLRTHVFATDQAALAAMFDQQP